MDPCHGYLPASLEIQCGAGVDSGSAAAPVQAGRSRWTVPRIEPRPLVLYRPSPYKCGNKIDRCNRFARKRRRDL